MEDMKLQEIKKKAIEEHIPILMDDTLAEIQKQIAGRKMKDILEIGTACRIF